MLARINAAGLRVATAPEPGGVSAFYLLFEIINYLDRRWVLPWSMRLARSTSSSVKPGVRVIVSEA